MTEHDVDNTQTITIWAGTLRAIGLLLLGAGAWRAFSNSASLAQGAVLIGTSIVLFFLSALDRLKSFSISISKLLELQAETRGVVREAKDVTNELRSLAKILGAEVLKLLVGGGRYGGSGRSAEIFDRTETLVGVLRTVGISESDINNIRKGTHHWLVIDYCSVISKLADAKRDSESNPIWNEFWTQWSNTTERPPADIVEKWLRKNGWIDNEIEEWIKDYRHFRETGEHRRQDHFRNRSDLRPAT